MAASAAPSSSSHGDAKTPGKRSLVSRSSMTAFLQRRSSAMMRKRDPELEEEEAEEEGQAQLQVELAHGRLSADPKRDLHGESKPQRYAHFVEDFRTSSSWQRPWVNWATGLVYEAYGREVEMEELWKLRDSERSAPLSDRLQKAWLERVRATPEGQKPELWRCVANLHWFEYTFPFMHMMGWLVCVLLTSGVFIVGLLDLLQDPDAPTVAVGSLQVPYQGFWYCLGFFLGEMFRSMFVNRHWELAMLTGVRARAACATLLFAKLTRLRRGGDGIGQLLNIVTNDLERVREAFMYGLFIITTPITLIAIIALGQWILGPSIWAGFVVLVLSVPVQTYIAKLSGKYRQESVDITDARVTLMNEILKAAQLIKLYAWEESFMANVAETRHKEMAKIRLSAYTKAFNMAFSQTVPIFTCLVAFLFHTLVFEQELTASQAFATLALFNISRFPLNVLPLGVRFTTEFFVAMRRISEFLLLEEVDEASTTRRELAQPGAPPHDCALEIEQALFTWAKLELAAERTPGNESLEAVRVDDASAAAGAGGDDASIELVVPALTVPRGSLVAVVGAVGSGKSSFFASLLGDMRLASGAATLRGTVAYVAQTPWVFNATLQDNILLGQPFDEARFATAVRACALQPDLDALPSGARTEIGERGINLSGGQKARLALARAVYAQADVYLLDDVLSAVDAHVSAHIWHECIKGVLSSKTVILATHALQYLPQTDAVAVFKDMQLRIVDTYAQVVAVPEYRAHVQAMQLEPGADRRTAETAEAKDASDAASVTLAVEQGAGEALSSGSPVVVDRPESAMTVESESAAADPTAGATLVTQEDRNEGSVSFKTVSAFASNAGGACTLWGCMAMFWVSEGSKFASDAWLTPWTDQTFEGREQWFYAVIYAGLAVGVGVLAFVRGIYFAWTALKAAQGLHDTAFLSVMRARMDFFQTTPLGRILARFSSDIDKVDVLLVDIAEMAISLLVRCFLSVAVICAVLPYFLIAVLPISYVYWRMLNFTRRVVRQMKRLDSISRSPLVSQFQSISQGLTSARAFGILDEANHRAATLVDETSRGFLGFQLSSRWVAIRVDTITTTIVAVSAVLCVLFASEISAGLAGLVITAALQTAGIFQFATRQAAELEAQFTSVERLRYFVESTPCESSTLVASESPLPPEWPQRGAIQFRGYSTRYRPGLPLVLNKLELSISAGSKTALCGRTGSGKSTVLLSCFRVLEAARGSVFIDGVDIASVPLAVLRGRAISVVPQDATLFAGSIRYNLDPFNSYGDEEIWEALERVHLADFVRSLGTEDVPGEDSANGSTAHRVANGAHSSTSDAPAKGRAQKAVAGLREGFVAPAASFANLRPSSGLNFVIEQGGINLSSGQRQLFCFARALLRKTRIICIDEGTSSVDSASDDKIQATLRDACEGVTLLVIAHRLQTVRNFDMVCVLDQGQLLEAGPPDELVTRKNGAFASMWQKSVSERSQHGKAQPNSSDVGDDDENNS